MNHLERMDFAVVPGEGNILAFPEGVRFETEERFVVLLARGIGKSPGTMAGVDQIALLVQAFLSARQASASI
jgi:hypothetical protein